MSTQLLKLKMEMKLNYEAKIYDSIKIRLPCMHNISNISVSMNMFFTVEYIKTMQKSVHLSSQPPFQSYFDCDNVNRIYSSRSGVLNRFVYTLFSLSLSFSHSF